MCCVCVRKTRFLPVHPFLVASSTPIAQRQCEAAVTSPLNKQRPSHPPLSIAHGFRPEEKYSR